MENSGSFNAIIVAWAWYYFARSWFDNLAGLTEAQRDSYEKKLLVFYETFLDRWIFSTQWANVWASRAVNNFRTFAKSLHENLKTLKQLDDVDEEYKAVENAAIALLDLDIVKSFAENHVNNVLVWDRKRVSTYKTLLWIWHRLDTERWKASEVPMRTRTEKGRLRVARQNVDHTVADAYWKRWVEKEIEQSEKHSIALPDGTVIRPGPGDFDTEKEALDFINTLGNCSFLEKSFNISKSDKTLWDFLQEVHEFKEGDIVRSDWERALSMKPEMVDPSAASFAKVVEAIQERDTSIRKDVIAFLRGEKHRKDV